MSDSETENNEIFAKVHKIFANNNLSLSPSDVSDISEVADTSHLLTSKQQENLLLGMSSEDELSDTDTAPQVRRVPGYAQLSPSEVASRIQTAAENSRGIRTSINSTITTSSTNSTNDINNMGNPSHSNSCGNVARKVEMFQTGQTPRHSATPLHSSRNYVSQANSVQKLKYQFDPDNYKSNNGSFSRRYTSPEINTFTHSELIDSGEFTGSEEYLYKVRQKSQLADTPSSDNQLEMSARGKSPVPLPRNIKTYSPEISPLLSHTANSNTRSQSIPHINTTQISTISASQLTNCTICVEKTLTNQSEEEQTIIHPPPEELYARPVRLKSNLSSKRRKRTLSASSIKISPPKRLSLSQGPEEISYQLNLPDTSNLSSKSLSPTVRRSRRLSLSSKLDVSQELLKTVRKSLTPEEARNLDETYNSYPNSQRQQYNQAQQQLIEYYNHKRTPDTEPPTAKPSIPAPYVPRNRKYSNISNSIITINSTVTDELTTDPQETVPVGTLTHFPNRLSKSNRSTRSRHATFDSSFSNANSSLSRLEPPPDTSHCTPTVDTETNNTKSNSTTNSRQTPSEPSCSNTKFQFQSDTIPATDSHNTLNTPPLHSSAISSFCTSNSHTSIDTITTDISCLSAPTHQLTFTSGPHFPTGPTTASLSGIPEPSQPGILTRSASRKSVELQHNKHLLYEQIEALESTWRQASSAVALCENHHSLKGSSQEVEAERLILSSNLRRDSLFHELVNLESGQEQSHVNADEIRPCVASLKVSNIRLTLNQQFVEYLTTRIGMKYLYNFVCIIKVNSPESVVSTHSITPEISVLNPNYSVLEFTDTLTLHGVESCFEMTVQIFTLELFKFRDQLQLSQCKTPVGRVKKLFSAAKKSGSPLRKHKSHKKNKKLPIITSDTNLPLKRSRFNLIATFSFKKSRIHQRKYNLETLSSSFSPYPLMPVIQMSISITPNYTQDITKGFLTIFHDDQTWNRRWCVLSGCFLSYWLYPDEEQNKKPMGCVDLQSVSGNVESTTRLECARMNAFSFICGKNTPKKYLISADSRYEKERWIVALKQVAIDVQTWNCLPSS